MDIRTELDKTQLDVVMADCKAELLSRIERHGNDSFVSSHECLGKLVEEMHELTEEVIANDPAAVEQELWDVAIAAIWAVASKRAANDWR